MPMTDLTITLVSTTPSSILWLSREHSESTRLSDTTRGGGLVTGEDDFNETSTYSIMRRALLYALILLTAKFSWELLVVTGIVLLEEFTFVIYAKACEFLLHRIGAHT